MLFTIIKYESLIQCYHFIKMINVRNTFFYILISFFINIKFSSLKY